ncbi:exonuclease 3'-5' domain-containing protein 2 [Elysia marginata]|uniref:Exonuclease 3'-5' domain-containing protein 2 n=1 Tax=Elysia marginata TaxID=1093978 RepID=A0AAV4HYZ4_9GAST|nr:exonuclease 3'-5' domain-containing protein 2 [Elysia marginata]
MMSGIGSTVKSRFTALLLSGIAAGVTFLVSWAVLRQLQRNKRKPYKVGHAIHIVNKPEEWDQIYDDLMKDIRHIRVLGLDCEWVQKKPVALLQLAAPSGLCVLVRLFKLGSSLPTTLRSLLADKSILKVGVAVTDDGNKLFQSYGLQVSGCVDLRHMLRRVRGVFHCSSMGLKGLASGVLDVDIGKSQNIRCGNWEAERYSDEQIKYAATDALVAVDIFVQIVYAKIAQGSSFSLGKRDAQNSQFANSAMSPLARAKSKESLETASSPTGSTVESKKELTQSQNEIRTGSCENEASVEELLSEINDQEKSQLFESRSLRSSTNQYKFEDFLRVQESNTDNSDGEQLHLFWKCAKSLCQGIVGAPYTFKGENKGAVLAPKTNGKVKDTSAYSVRKRPLWDNCKLEAPDGTMLCTCDARKAQWYLDKELADKILDNPLTVRLRFEPSRRPQEEMSFYKQEKLNICVVCGHDKDYIRKFVIPYEYRKYLPFALKDHSSHDVLLLCTACHRRSCDFDAQLRLRLAQECNAPVESGAAAKVVLDHDLQKIRSAGRALKLNRLSIPKDRVSQLESVLCSHFGVDHLTEDLVEQAAEIDARHTSSEYVPHAKQVVRHMISNGGLLAFQARWRQHFLDTMKPQHLPAFWSVDFVPDGWLHSEAES